MSRLDYTAKLLATENISVRQVGSKTAAFDVVNRVLFLPAWKDMSKDLYDLMVGHEVGHALYTPADGWHESEQEFDFPRSFINIIEDIRIERMVQDKYPGLRGPFKRGYMELLDRDFFGTAKRPMETFGFMDRLNIKSKVRDLMDVPFTAEELPYVKLATGVQTFEDVLNACAEIYKWLQEEKENECKGDATGVGKNQASSNDFSDQEFSGNAPSANSDSEEDTESMDGLPTSGSKPDVNESSDSNETSKSESVPSTPEDSKEDDGSSVNEDKPAGDVQGAASSAANEKPTPSPVAEDTDADEVETDNTFRSKQDDLIESDRFGNIPTFSEGLSADEVKRMIVPFNQIVSHRLANIEERANDYPNAYEETENDYLTFVNETKKVVNSMAKEFEMRKAAYQYSRAKESKSGSLDVTKLHAYKFTDDLFLRTTNLADAKSHGIVAFIDFSGSMHGVIDNVVHQAIVLATFCRKVGIPFDIYSFTSPTAPIYNEQSERLVTSEGHISLRSCSLLQQLSSTMSKPEFTNAVRSLFFAFHNPPSSYHRCIFASEYDHLGGTPLNEALIAAHTILKKFKQKNGVQKVNLVTITDGDSQYLEVNGEGRYGRGGYKVRLNNKYVSLGNGREVTECLLANLKKEGYNTISYFILDRVRDMKYRTYTLGQRQQQKVMKEFRANKVAAMPKGFGGYDSYFFIDGRQDAANDDFEVSDNAKKGEIARAFRKFAKSKKQNRTLAVKFAEAIA